jgi:hypothetical protein
VRVWLQLSTHWLQLDVVPAIKDKRSKGKGGGVPHETRLGKVKFKLLGGMKVVKNDKASAQLFML